MLNWDVGVYLDVERQGPHMYCRARIINDRVTPPVEVTADLLVDSGAQCALLLPQAKVERLVCEKWKTDPLRGFRGDSMSSSFYR